MSVLLSQIRRDGGPAPLLRGLALGEAGAAGVTASPAELPRSPALSRGVGCQAFSALRGKGSFGSVVRYFEGVATLVALGAGALLGVGVPLGETKGAPTMCDAPLVPSALTWL
jgi:hypothetical protein